MSTLPSSSENRIITVDALRGFALFGILYAHMTLWYTAGPMPERLFKNIDISSGIAMGLSGLFFMSKFFSFFSFLFGLSFYIQMKTLEKRNDNFVLRYGWRLLILGIIGLIHHALWRGDILSIYVPLGFLLLFARNLSNKIILIAALILMLNIPTKIYEAATIILHTGYLENVKKIMSEGGEHYYDIVKNGSLMELIKDNWSAMAFKFKYQLTSGRLLITFGFFLLGMYVGRMKWFEKLDEVRPFVKKIWKSTSFILLGTLAFTIVLASVNFGLGLNLQENQWIVWASGFLVEVFNSGTTLFYITGLILLMYRSAWQKFLFPLANIGKMALTSYLMQTLFGLLIFYSFGLGLFTVTTPAINAIICLGIFTFQVFFSKLWLKYFTYGPVEWLWRSLTFLRLQPMISKGKLVPVTEAIVTEK